MTRRSGLGRGLDALLPPGDAPAADDSGPLRMVPVGAIEANPDQPRRNFDEDALAELADSISAVGILQPLVVRAGVGGRFSLVAGERRWRAAQRAGLEQVPVLVVETDERGALERALVENLQRRDLNPIEEAAAYRQLLDEGGLTQEELGQRLGRNRVSITQALSLLELPASVQAYLVEGKLTAGHGRVLLQLRDNPFQDRLAQRAAMEGLSVRETRDLVERYGSMTSSTPSSVRSQRHASAHALELQERLAERLSTRVRIEESKRKGRIVIEFSDQEDLTRVANILTGRADGASTSVASPERQADSA